MKSSNYGGYYCSQKSGDQWCVYKGKETGEVYKKGAAKPSYTSNEEKFVKSLPTESGPNKDQIITKLAIAKSILERGSQWNTETEVEANLVLKWVRSNS